jgi:predicted AlkP superfamily pyrophosphatase or phosphodiesterase
MFRSATALLFLCLATSLFAADAPKDRYVVLISVDGLAAFYFDDPKAEMPTIRSLAKSGARAESMVCSFPTVTWPNHTTLVTGVNPARHGVLGNNYLDRETAKPVALIPDPLYDKDQIVKVPTIYDVAHKAGLSTAGILWPASRNAKSLDWTVPDMNKDGWDKYGTPSWLEELRQAGIPVDRHVPWCEDKVCGVMRDWLYARMADHVIQNHSPNLCLIHFIELDHIQHSYGPQTPEAYWAVSQADQRVHDVVESVKRSKHADQTTIVVVSDHGFRPIEKEIRPNVLFKQAQLGAADADARPVVKSVAQGGGCMVYILDPARKSELMPKLTGLLAKVDGVAAVLEEADFAKYGVALSKADANAPDFWLSAKTGYSFTDSSEGDDAVVPRATKGGTHGYLPDQADLFGTLVINGRGVSEGINLGQVRNLDVAPTIAKLLGVTMPDVDGAVLEKALK